jgi:hypothetical protein
MNAHTIQVRRAIAPLLVLAVGSTLAAITATTRFEGLSRVLMLITAVATITFAVLAEPETWPRSSPLDETNANHSSCSKLPRSLGSPPCLSASHLLAAICSSARAIVQSPISPSVPHSL